MANYCKAFGMKVIVYEPYKVVSEQDVLQVNDLNQLLISSDVISLHASKNDKNPHLIDKKAFDLMKSNCIFINTSRGGLVDEKAMLDALKESKIYAAGIDVLEGELSKNDQNIIDINNLKELALNYKNLFISPHIGGSTIEARIKRSEFTTNLMLKWARVNKN
tara:strand:- start:220 stop:708 length:489 start_codon:yes stop_codon:yes gene_type:complete